jgi:predicted MarR family transcription regulator
MNAMNAQRQSRTLSLKQLELLHLIARSNSDGSLIDFDQLLERLSYRPSKMAAQFSIRALLARGLIQKAGREKRRARVRRLFSITPLGQHYVGPMSIHKDRFSPEWFSEPVAVSVEADEVNEAVHGAMA